MKAKVPRQTERDFQRTVIEAAHLFGWRVAHFRAARTAHGWRTAVAADGAGFPDLVLARGARGDRPGRILFVELKRTRAHELGADQQAWADTLIAAGGEALRWDPEDWPEIEAQLF